MRIVVAAVGKPRNAALAAAILDYETRAARYWPLEVHEVREERAASASPGVVRERVGDRLLEQVGGTAIVVCDANGKSLDSENFAQWLQREREKGQDTSFVIGGAFGLSASVIGAARLKLSLAPWTLPHELARLVLAEQLYRAGTIIRGEPYHK
jgi:23S rRNA (pseudouridine1915-N3)-methyltransferase